MSLKLLEYALTILCVSPNEIRTNRCIDFMINCATIKNNHVYKDNFEACEMEWKEKHEEH